MAHFVISALSAVCLRRIHVLPEPSARAGEGGPGQPVHCAGETGHLEELKVVQTIWFFHACPRPRRIRW